MSTVCVQSSPHPKCSNTDTNTTNISIISDNKSNNYRNYGNEIAITALPALQNLNLSTLNCTDIGIDVNNYGNSCLQTIKANPMSHRLSTSSVPSIASNPPFIQIPFGWRRELIDGRIVYYSPTNCCLQSIDELSKYLESDGTCKCGLECPLYIWKTFNFDAGIPSKAYDLEVAKHSNQNKLCNHKRKIIALATYKEHRLFAEQHQTQSRLQHKHNHSDTDRQGYEFEDNSNVEPKCQQRPDFQSGGNICAQLNQCFSVSSVPNHNSNSTQLNFRKCSNDPIIDTVSVIHSNQRFAKSGQTLCVSEPVINGSAPHICSNLNVNRLHNRDERQTIIGSQQQYIQQTNNNDNRCHYSVPISAEHIPQAANSFCLYDNSGNSSVYSFSPCDSTHISVQPNDNKTSIYLTPQNTGNFGQMISYENPNISLIQSSHSQTFSPEVYSHAFHPSDNVCNSNITNISSYIPLHSPSSANSGAISFSASPLSTTAIALNPSYHSGLQTSHDNSRCHSQNNISILPQNPPMPPLSVPNVTTVTTSVTDVIPAVGAVGPQIINTTNPSGGPQVLQFINSVPLTQITANTVTVLQQTSAPEVPVPATTLIIPHQLMPPHEHPVMINHAMAPQTAMFPHIATATGLTSLPNAFQNAISIANAISLPQRNCISETGKPFSRTRKRKDYNRTNRSHPPTVASILKRADNEKKQKEQELNEKQKIEQKDKELQTINEINCEINSRSDETEASVDSTLKESISVAVQSELQLEYENPVNNECQRLPVIANDSQVIESSQSDNECNYSLTGDNGMNRVAHEIPVQSNRNDENPISDSSSEHSSPSSECCNGTGSDSGVESEPTANSFCDNRVVPDSQQVVDNNSRQKSLKRLKRLRKELSIYYGNDNSDDESPQSPPLPPQTRTFNSGDLVWGQMGDVRFWPGKLVDDHELIGLSIQRETGKLIVKWFGDRSVTSGLTQVDPENLKTLSEGLEEHHCARKRHRSGKRMNPGLEQAIQEAMTELDRQTNDISLDSSSSRVLGVVTSTQTIDTIE